jgi:cytochrome c oxidase subunit 2
MWSNLPIMPEQASSVAARVDALFFFLVSVSVVFSSLIFVLILTFAVKYRRRSEADRPPAIHGDVRLELLWTIIPFGLTMVMFVWGAQLYVDIARPPQDALEIYAVGKQWMWKFQHPSGQREINQLHVPMGRAVKLTMASEDVIHDLFVPAFRVKMDVVPGRYTSAWFEATKAGTYHLFCAEYCGTAHAGMIGKVVVLTPADYEQWLSGGVTGESMAMAGGRLFEQLGCRTCHRPEASARGPALDGLFGRQEVLQTGEQILVDEAYIRESILNPNAKIVAGYQPIMPTFQGQISEDGLLQIIAYIRSLGAGRKEAN